MNFAIWNAGSHQERGKRFYCEDKPYKGGICWLNYDYLTYNYFSNNFDWIMSLDLKDKNFSFIANSLVSPLSTNLFFSPDSINRIL